MFAAGKDVTDVSIWLQRIGFPAAEAEAFLAELAETKRNASWARRGGFTGLVLGALISVILTLLYRPWEVAWVGSISGRPIDSTTVVVYWCAGLSLFTLMCGFVAMIAGLVIDRLGEGRTRR